MQRSLPHVPAQARAIVEAMLRPETLAIIAGTLVVWAGSHFFGFGRIVDVILLGTGVFILGFAVFEGASEFYDFVTGAINARSEADLEQAGRHFARAVTLLGISTVQSLLLRGQGRAVSSRAGAQKLIHLRRLVPHLLPGMLFGSHGHRGFPVAARAERPSMA
ncbi:hypothetical protein [Candidatus Thiosymbion oneisti]|uniref:hypothetical protein n=1 Tax=Candidatus Thiosymbion oneisti TaxID=589554 RepID=UPI00105E10E8|nr:hypothetical protein [Candidatus Thiosymbion oneisti]